jgi:amino acid transporter
VVCWNGSKSKLLLNVFLICLPFSRISGSHSNSKAINFDFTKAFPVVTEEMKDAVKSTPKAVNYTMLTLFGYAGVLLVLVPTLPPYTKGLPGSLWPIVESSVSSVFGEDSWLVENSAAIALYKSLTFLMMVPCQVTTAMADLYACSRYVYGLSRGGFIPTELSVTFTGDTADLEKEPSVTLPGVRQLSGLNSAQSNSISQSANNQVSVISPPSAPIVSEVNEAEQKDEGATRRRRSTIDTGIRGRALSISAFAAFLPPSLVQGQLGSGLRRLSVRTFGLTDANRCPKRAVAAAGALCAIFNILVEGINAGTSSSNKSNNGVVDNSADNLLRMAVWFACLGYLVQLCAYIAIRMNMKNLQRPSPSPTGIPGVIASLVITIAFGLIGPFFLESNQIYVTSIIVMICFTVAFFAYYQVYAVPRLRNSPERLFILYVVCD